MTDKKAEEIFVPWPFGPVVREKYSKISEERKTGKKGVAQDNNRHFVFAFVPNECCFAPDPLMICQMHNNTRVEGVNFCFAYLMAGFLSYPT